MSKHNGRPQDTDPTKNVLDIVAAEAKRQDDLRVAESRRIDEKMLLVSKYEALIAKAEAKRIDSNRAFDVDAIAVAATKAELTAGVLAANVGIQAETLRKLVESTAKAAAESLERWASTIAERLSVLEAARYENKGRQGLSTPLIIGISTIAGGFIGFLVQQLFKVVASK